MESSAFPHLLRCCAVLVAVMGCGRSSGGESVAELFVGPVEVVADGLGFTEGPVWLAGNSELVFSDIPNGKLMVWSEAGGLRVFREEANPNGNLLDASGRLLTCRHGARDVVRTELGGELTVLASSWDDKRFNSPNDLAVDRDGSIWFTDPPWGLEGQKVGREIDGNYVYRVDSGSGVVANMSTIHAMPNGIAFAPDFEALYVSDTGGHDSHPDEAMRSAPALITKFEVQRDAAGGPGNLAVLWQVPGRSDGMAVDVDGRLYTTARSGIVVLDPKDGSTLAELPLDEAPTNCCFGGADGKTLYITARSTVYSVQVSTAGASHKP